MKRKEFKDFDVADFTDMGSLPKREMSTSRRPFFGFNKTKASVMSPAQHSVSNLAAVL